MTAPLGDLSIDEFLGHYWQRRPCLIRQAFPGFDPLLDGDDLAGLACDPLAEARLVSGRYPEPEWQVRNGPFTDKDFQALGDRDWTLLVQDVEKHYPPLQSVPARFDFLPAWRLDDLMASYAAPGGSVGPHVDQYDVFLLQAAGRRRWEIAEVFDPSVLPDAPLAVLRRFEAEQAWDTEAGDLLYLPPGVAHHGVALEPCMTYSIGLRAPSAADLHLALGEHLAALPDEGGRYADAASHEPSRPGEIGPAALTGLRRVLQGGMGPEPAANDFLGAFMSRYRLAQEPAPLPRPVSAEAVSKALAGGAGLQRNPWTRLNWFERQGRARLFAAGEAFDCSLRLAAAVCSQPIEIPTGCEFDPADLAALTGLVRGGHLVLAGRRELS